MGLTLFQQLDPENPVHDSVSIPLSLSLSLHIFISCGVHTQYDGKAPSCGRGITVFFLPIQMQNIQSPPNKQDLAVKSHLVVSKYCTMQGTDCHTVLVYCIKVTGGWLAVKAQVPKRLFHYFLTLSEIALSSFFSFLLCWFHPCNIRIISGWVPQNSVHTVLKNSQSLH